MIIPLILTAVIAFLVGIIIDQQAMKSALLKEGYVLHWVTDLNGKGHWRIGLVKTMKDVKELPDDQTPQT